VTFYTPAIAALVVSLCSVASAQTAPLASSAEQRTVRAFAEARKNPLTLRAFLQDMPKVEICICT
jgi:hypothetical protein